MHEIRTKGMRFLDALGRERIFHGLNLKADIKEGDPEYGKLKLLDEEFFRRSASYGFNVLRLGVAWKNLEPIKGKYDEALLRRIDEIFALAERYGMYIFLDMHQDVYHGMPGWATITDGFKRRAKPRFVWSEDYYWGRAVHRAFDHFWENTPVQGKGLQDHFAALWQDLARRYAGRPAFLGFDLFNEPFPGKDGGLAFRKMVRKLISVAAFSPAVNRAEFIKNALRRETRSRAALDAVTSEVLRKVTSAADGVVRKFDIERYTPFLSKMAAAVREVTPKGVIFMENCYYSNLGIPYAALAPTVNGVREPNVSYSPHAYDLTVDAPGYAYASNERVGSIFAERRRAQERLQAPVLVGEWGAGYMGEKCYPHIAFLLHLFDSYKWSFAYFTHTEDLYDSPLMDILVRPYPVAVNGEIKAFGSDADTSLFTLEFTQADGFAPLLVTEIYLPRSAECVEAAGFEWREEAIDGGEGKTLLLTGGGAGDHRVTIQL